MSFQRIYHERSYKKYPPMDSLNANMRNRNEPLHIDIPSNNLLPCLAPPMNHRSLRSQLNPMNVNGTAVAEPVANSTHIHRNNSHGHSGCSHRSFPSLQHQTRRPHAEHSFPNGGLALNSHFVRESGSNSINPTSKFTRSCQKCSLVPSFGNPCNCHAPTLATNHYQVSHRCCTNDLPPPPPPSPPPPSCFHPHPTPWSGDVFRASCSHESHVHSGRSLQQQVSMPVNNDSGHKNSFNNAPTNSKRLPESFPFKTVAKEKKRLAIIDPATGQDVIQIMQAKASEDSKARKTAVAREKPVSEEESLSAAETFRHVLTKAVQAETTSTIPETAPIAAEAIPAVNKTASVAAETTTTMKKTASVATQTIPAMKETESVAAEAKPAVNKTASVAAETTPTVKKTASATIQTTPAVNKTASVTAEITLAVNKTASVTAETAPTENETQTAEAVAVVPASDRRARKVISREDIMRLRSSVHEYAPRRRHGNVPLKVIFKEVTGTVFPSQAPPTVRMLSEAEPVHFPHPSAPLYINSAVHHHLNHIPTNSGCPFEYDIGKNGEFTRSTPHMHSGYQHVMTSHGDEYREIEQENCSNGIPHHSMQETHSGNILPELFPEFNHQLQSGQNSCGFSSSAATGVSETPRFQKFPKFFHRTLPPRFRNKYKE